jgi:signal transduction histidine kinase
LLAQSVLDTRDLTFELSPPVLYDLGMKEALAWLAEQIEEEHSVRVVVTDDGQGAPFDAVTMAMLFRAVRELLVNVVKHAQAATAKVTLRRQQDQFEISVEDPGVGFDTGFPTAARSYGLFSVREQIGRLGGSLLVDSAPHQGTRVQLRIPIRANGHLEGPSPRGEP